MRFDKVSPTAALAPYIKYYVIAENALAGQYTVFPATSLVIGFQYRGSLAQVQDSVVSPLSVSGITGLSNSFKVFRNSPDIGTVLVYFTGTGLIHFTANPAHELFNQSVGMDYIFPLAKVREAEERLALAANDGERVAVMDRFFLSLLKEVVLDKLIVEAVKRIYAAKGVIKVKTLQEELFISQSPFEKRFRSLVGTSPKKFASIVRFNAVMSDLGKARSLTELCYEYGYFDQSHFIKDFKQFTGKTPEEFK
jgi:AraC-like DNA-binding protein